MMMNGIMRLLFSIILTVAIAPGVRAASADDEATITVVGEGETPDDVVTVIELPDHAKADNKSGGATSGGSDSSSARDKAGSAHDAGQQQVSADTRDNNGHGQEDNNGHGQGDDNAHNDARNDQRNDNAGGANRHGPH